MATLWASGIWEILGGHWVFALEKDENGEVVKYKVGFVAECFIQVFGSDYLEVFAPTVKLSSICMFLFSATHFRGKVFQFHFSLAYLNADLEEDVYVEPPPALEIPGKGSKVFRNLSKVYYGLKQARRC